MTHELHEEDLDRAVAGLRIARPSDAPTGDSHSLLEAIMNQASSVSEVTATAPPVDLEGPRGRRRRVWWLSGAGTAAAAAAALTVVLTGGPAPTEASAAEVVASAATRVEAVTALHSTMTSQFTGGASSETTIDLSGDDFQVETVLQAGDVRETASMIYVDGVLYERQGDQWVSDGTDVEDQPPFDEASAALVRAAVDEGSVETVGQDGDTVLYRVAVDEQLRSRLAALPTGVLAWFELEAIGSVPGSDGAIDELIVGVDQVTGIVGRIRIETTDGSVTDIRNSIPGEPVAIEPPTDPVVLP